MLSELMFVQSSLSDVASTNSLVGSVLQTIRGKGRKMLSFKLSVHPWWTTMPMFGRRLQKHSTPFKNTSARELSTRRFQLCWRPFVNQDRARALLCKH